MKLFSLFLILFVTVFACKTIDEDMITPGWIVEKIKILESDCYYSGSTIKRYTLDSIEYVEFFIPNHLWPIENVYDKDGTQVYLIDTTFSYYYFKNNRGDAIETIWKFPENSGC